MCVHFKSLDTLFLVTLVDLLVHLCPPIPIILGSVCSLVLSFPGDSRSLTVVVLEMMAAAALGDLDVRPVRAGSGQAFTLLGRLDRGMDGGGGAAAA